jgi:hypothetical protein
MDGNWIGKLFFNRLSGEPIAMVDINGLFGLGHVHYTMGQVHVALGHADHLTGLIGRHSL